jgi:hypothetical protein
MSSILDSIKKTVLTEKTSEQDNNADKVDFDMAAQLESKKRARKAKDEDEDMDKDDDDKKSSRRARKAKDEDEDMDNDDDKKSSRRSRKAKDDDEDEDQDDKDMVKEDQDCDDTDIVSPSNSKMQSNQDNAGDDNVKQGNVNINDSGIAKRKAKDEDEDDDDTERDDDDKKSSRKSRKAKLSDDQDFDGVKIDDNGVAKRKASRKAKDDDDDNDDEDDELETDKIKIEKKVKKEDLDLDEHMAALFGSDKTLTEDFKGKAKTIFEAAVLTLANKAVAEVSAEFKAAAKRDMVAFQKSYDKAMVEKVDGYLESVIEEWFEANKPVHVRNIKTELAESFLGGLKTLFAEHYVELPEEKVDLVRALTEKAESLESKLNKEYTRSQNLKEQVVSLKKEQIILESSSGLSVNEKEKLQALSEGLDFVNASDYEKKVLEIKESYFSPTRIVNTIEDDEEPIKLDEEVTVASEHPEVRGFAEVMSRHLGGIKKPKAK